MSIFLDNCQLSEEEEFFGTHAHTHTHVHSFVVVGVFKMFENILTQTKFGYFQVALNLAIKVNFSN